MEAGRTFLNPRNLFLSTPQGVNFEYDSIPFSPWRPSISVIERHLPLNGSLALLYRYVRLAWVFTTLPSWIGLVLLMEVCPKSWAAALGDAILPKRKGWTFSQRVGYPVLSRLVWAITFGVPCATHSETAKSTTLEGIFYGRGTDTVTVNVAFASREEEGKWIQDDAVDPLGKIVPERCLPAFWCRPQNVGTERAREKGLQAVLYLVGGGYLAGHPTESSRIYDMVRYSHVPVLSANYRKATSAAGAFPAGLQDTIAAYAYLLREGYTRIALAGDSAGAGLSLALMQYLARLAEKDAQDRPDTLIMPERACFYSPWADMTFSHDYGRAVYFDIIHTTMLRSAASVYGCNLHNYRSGGDTCDKYQSIAKLQQAHPYLSPALKSATPSLRSIKSAAEALGQKPPSFLIFYGGAELFHTECASLCDNLREAGLEVEEYVEEDEVHGFLLVPSFLSPAVLPALNKMGKYLSSAA